MDCKCSAVHHGSNRYADGLRLSPLIHAEWLGHYTWSRAAYRCAACKRSTGGQLAVDGYFMEMGRLHFRPHGLRQIKTGMAIKCRRIRRQSTQSAETHGKARGPRADKAIRWINMCALWCATAPAVNTSVTMQPTGGEISPGTGRKKGRGHNQAGREEEGRRSVWESQRYGEMFWWTILFGPKY